MEANHPNNPQFTQIHHSSLQICQNKQAMGLENEWVENQKTSLCEKLEDSKNQVKTHRLNHCKVSNKKQKNSETSKDLQLYNLDTKKQIQFVLDNGEHFTENPSNRFDKNCQILDHFNGTKQYKKNDQNNLESKQWEKINYNNSNTCRDIQFNSNLKLYDKQPLFIPKISLLEYQKIAQMLDDEQLSFFHNGSQILFPIPDYILRATANQEQLRQCRRAVNPKQLPKGFSQMIELLNLSYLFPQKFKLSPETISKLNQILQTTLQSKDHSLPQNPSLTETQLNDMFSECFLHYVKELTELLILDLTPQKLQSLTNTFCYNVLSLAKFCQQNQLLNFVFQYNWPLVLGELVKVNLDKDQDNSFKGTDVMQMIQSNIDNNLHQLPHSFPLRFELISLLIDCYSRTISFRELFNKKAESTRNINKKKSQLQDEKKALETKLKKFISSSTKKTKKISKQSQKKTKPNTKQDHQQDQDNEKDEKFPNNGQGEEIQKLRKDIQTLGQQIQKENRQDCLSLCHYLGKDRYGQLYWYISFFSDKLFIEKESIWSCLGVDQMHFLLEGLQRRGIEENRLYERIQEYYSLAMSRYSSRMEVQTEENNLMSKSSNLFMSSSTLLEKNSPNMPEKQESQMQQDNIEDHDSSKNSHENNELHNGIDVFRIDQQSLTKMIEQGEKKMTEYLKDRNSRWGSEQNKHQLFTILNSTSPSWLEQAKRQISTFNEKICVVQIQYKVYVQQSVQQVDSKVKKIQTKIWGINEKYKHNWYHFVNDCTTFAQLFFAVSVLYSLIKKYTSKQRKLRKQYEEVKQKSVLKMTPVPKQWKQSWNDQCEVCGNNGEVLCCDHCPKVYHLSCVNLTQIPETQFKCKSCKQQITTRNQFKNLTNLKKKTKK